MKKYEFDANTVTQECIDWIKNYFVRNGTNETLAVVGISGGKDSAVAAALCVKALGEDRVLGVKIPQGKQEDIEYANMLIQYLKISSMEINIRDTCIQCYDALYNAGIDAPEISRPISTNLPARIRMTMLYAVAAEYHGRVVNTCNYSEDYVGYSTKFGDGAGDFAPLAKLTSEEVIEVGKVLGLPEILLEKPPADGLSGLTDEENLGFSYAQLNDYLRRGIVPDINTLQNIESRHTRNVHKLTPMPVFIPGQHFYF